jgi:hypothetical protein
MDRFPTLNHTPQDPCRRSDHRLAARTGGLQYRRGGRVRGCTDVATGLTRRLNDPAHGLRCHGGTVRPTVHRPGDCPLHRSVRHGQEIPTHVTHIYDEALGSRRGTRHTPHAHIVCRLQSACDHVTPHGDRLTDHTARCLDGRGHRLADQGDDLRPCAHGRASTAEALASPCCSADVFCPGLPPERGKG